MIRNCFIGAPLHVGAYVRESVSRSLVYKVLNFVEVLLYIALIVLTITLIYNIVTLAIENHKRKMFLLEDTNKRILELEKALIGEATTSCKEEVSEEEVSEEEVSEEEVSEEEVSEEEVDLITKE